MGVIKSSNVGSLEEPLHQLRLVQAVAKIHEYKEFLLEENRPLLRTDLYNSKEKRAMFVELLKKKIKSWYETMTPVPWKKSCQWKSTDLFVGSGLILIDSKSKQNIQNIDEKCKLSYKEIFTHKKLKSEIRIKLEGDPGAGKTMLLSQLAYDWSKGNIDGVDILIFLPLKIFGNKTLIQAVKEFYIPMDMGITEEDIETILASTTETICLLLDGLEEYNTGKRKDETKESTEVMKIMKKEKHSNCKVVISTRSDFAHDLSECPSLKVGTFGEHQRESYIKQLYADDTEKQQKIQSVIGDNSFLLDLCSVPLLFVLAVHNIGNIDLSEDTQLHKVSPFIRNMILTLCPADEVKHEIEGIPSEFNVSKKKTLGELAFNGLCKGHQQLSWPKTYMGSNVLNFKLWVDSGILVLEEGLITSEKQDQDVSDAIALQGKEFPGSSTSHDTPKSSTPPELSMTASGTPTDRNEASVKEQAHQSDSKIENDPPGIKQKSVRRTAHQVSLVVKFLHKVIQEWFAATFFSSMMRRCSSKDEFQNYVTSQLQHIRPTDLHYVLRFTSYLHPQSCDLIMNYLIRSYRKDGSVPPYIMNCVFLCFNEHSDDKGHDMRNAVEYVCKEVITIQSEDSRLLQQAKAALVQYASNNGITIEKLHLRDVIFSVDQTSLILNSGVHLEILHTVKLIEVSRWDQVLQEDDCKDILKLLSTGNLLKEVRCIFPCQPPSLDEITLGNIISKDIKVEWKIGNFVQSLDPIKGEWMTNSKWPGTSFLKKRDVSENQGASKNGEKRKQSTTSSLPGTSTESSKYVQTQGTLKQKGIGSCHDVEEASLPGRKTKVVLEKTSESDCTQEGQNREQMVVFDGITDRGVEGRDFQEVALASCVEQSPFTEEIPVTRLGHRFYQEEAAAGERLKLDQMTMGLGGLSLQGSPDVNIASPMFSPSVTCSDVIPRTFYEDGSVESALKGNAPFLEAQSCMETKAIITNKGGVLEIHNTGVVLQIPPDALPDDKKQCEIHAKIILSHVMTEKASTFSSNSSTVVELLPNNLRFRLPVRLRVPHCLVLNETKEQRTRIFLSHHEKGSIPRWEEHTHFSYHLEDTTCIIFLDRFSWVTFSVDDEIVEAKKLVVYTAARKLQPQDSVAQIHVGYYLDLPGQEKQVVEDHPELVFAHRKTFYFLKTSDKVPLNLSLENISQSGWEFVPIKGKVQKITYDQIVDYRYQLRIYHIEKTTDEVTNPLCIFTVSQGNIQVAVQLAIHLKVGEEEPLLACALKPGIHCASMTNDGGQLVIPDTRISLTIPPNALPTDMDQCQIQMSLAPSRVIEGQIKSFCLNSTTAVDITPCGFKLERPAQLHLPHCLKVYEEKKKQSGVKIFTNLENGSPSLWQMRSDIEYELKEDTCIVNLNELCCVKYHIDETIVKSKRIFVYTTVKRIKHKDKFAVTEVGCYPDIPLGGELLRLNPLFGFDSKRPFLCKKEEASPLHVLLESIRPQQWTCWVPKEKHHEIPFNVIASSIEHSHLYVLQKINDQRGNTYCEFSASQKSDSVDLTVRLSPPEEHYKGNEQPPLKKACEESMITVFQYLSERLSTEWRNVGRNLGLQEAKLSRIQLDYQSSTQETIYQMLLQWRQIRGSKATHYDLIKALEQSGRTDLAEKV